MIFKAVRRGMAATAAVALLAACTAPSPDCSGTVGNSKTACHHDATNTRSPDNSNNPDQGE